MTGVHVLDPLTDARWDDLTARHPRATVFHSRGWLEALKRTYGYEPFVLTTTGQGPLENGLAVCRVKTLVTRRLVSLPFSDHCEPLAEQPEDLSAMLRFLAGEMERGRWRSLELRPRSEGFLADGGRPFRVAERASYCLHTLNLAQPPEDVFKAFHRSSMQQPIRRAEREGLVYEAGTSGQLLSGLYGVLRLARRRHGLPPQPFSWFRNLAATFGDRLAVHLASKDGLPLAGILTLSFKKTMVYKYGGSDAAHHRLGGMPFLFWRVIQGAQAQGIEELDLGRSDLDQPGLLAFKDHLGAARSSLTYYGWPKKRAGAAIEGPVARVARRVLAHLPDAALDLTGRVLYRHLG